MQISACIKVSRNFGDKVLEFMKFTVTQQDIFPAGNIMTDFQRKKEWCG
jgi:hypothetical protein